MWNLLAIGANAPTYRPSTATGTMTDSASAYDDENYPFLTKGVVAQTGSSVAGTPDNLSVVFSGFSSLAKTGFSNVSLSTVYDVVDGANWVPGAQFLSCGFRLEYSIDAGSSYVPWALYSDAIGTFPSYAVIDLGYPASDYADPVNVAGIVTTTSRTGVTASVSIASTSLSTNLSDLRVKFTASTIKSTKAGNPTSSLTYKVWDIRAVVS